MKVWSVGSALRGGSLDGSLASRDVGAVGTALRLRDRLAPKRPSSVTGGDMRDGVEGPFTIGETIGEYGRGVDENEET